MGGTCSKFEERKGAYRDLARKSEGKSRLEHTDVDGNMILKLIFKK